jgi:hypothetical protein
MNNPAKTPALVKPNGRFTFGAEDAAKALNEHGFLFQLLVRKNNEIQHHLHEDSANDWQIVGEEYPVTALDGTQTRIDLVLRHQRSRGFHICLESKRPNPKFKSWLFFDEALSVVRTANFFLESSSRIVELEKPTVQCKVFRYYVEAAIKRGGNESVSASDNIETAFRQLIAGSSGLMRHLRAHGDPQDTRHSVSALVTAAKLFEVAFDIRAVWSDGTIDPSNLSLVPIDFCAVNYHADDSFRLDGQPQAALRNVVSSLIAEQRRSIFIVQASSMKKFLEWAGCLVV